MTDGTMAPPIAESELMTPAEIRAFRAEHDLTRIQLAVLLGVTPGTVRNWEQNIRNMSRPIELSVKRITKAQIARVKREYPEGKPGRPPGRRRPPTVPAEGSEGE